MDIIALCVIGWIAFGLLAVYLAGKADRAMGGQGYAPTTALFILGPIGVFIAGIIYLSTSQSNSNLITKVYNLGNTEK